MSRDKYREVGTRRDEEKRKRKYAEEDNMVEGMFFGLICGSLIRANTRSSLATTGLSFFFFSSILMLFFL